MARNKSDLSRSAIVGRALEIADAEGLDAVSFRRLAQEFGVTAMALYWHVKNKEELLDAMGDAIFEGVDYRTEPDDDWTVQLRAVIVALVDALRAHPTCLELAYRRILACPDGLELAEHTLTLLHEQGFAARQVADIAAHALQTAVMLVTGEPGAEHGKSDEEGEALRAQKLANIAALPAERYPMVRQLGANLIDCDDVPGYYAFNIDLFVGGVRAMRDALAPR